MYASVLQLRRYLNQVPEDTASDVLLAEVLTRASSIVDLALSDIFVDAATPGTKVIYGDGTTFLPLPPYTAGTITSVTSLSSVVVPAWVEDGRYLRVVDSQGVQPSYPRRSNRYSWYTGYEDDVTNGHVVLFGGGGGGMVWRSGVPYTVAATFGRNPATADTFALEEATLEIAAAIVKDKDAGFATVIGVEGGGAVNIRNALPLKAQSILSALATRYTPTTHTAVVY